MPHSWIEVGGRRWCLGCGCYQVRRGGNWRDDPSMVGDWPAYAPTVDPCARDTPWATSQRGNVAPEKAGKSLGSHPLTNNEN